MGNPGAVTPVVDRLVETDAVSFSGAFCQNPVCTPSRCSFMSGWYPHVRGHRTMRHMLRDGEGDPNLLKILKEHDYYIWWGGKNDLVPGQDGYEQFCHTHFAAEPQDYERWGHRPAPNLHGWTNWRGEPGSDTYYSFFVGKLEPEDDDIWCDRDWANVLGAIDFIRAYPDSGEERPLFIYLPLTYPHPPYGVEDPWHGLIDRDAVPERSPAPEGWRGKPETERELARLHNMSGWSEERWRELRAVYYGMCARVDHQLGLVLDALREAGLYDDTALFLFSDHGDYTGDYGLVEKTQNTFEDCLTRVPLIFKPPAMVSADRGIRAGVSDSLVELVDFPATVYELTGIEPGYSHYGRSLLGVADGTDSGREAVFCEGGRLTEEEQCMEMANNPELDPGSLYWPRQKLQRSLGIEHGKAVMCRTRELKYVRRYYEQDELYDLVIDPGETVNVVDDPVYAGRLTNMKERLIDWYLGTCDTVPWEIDERTFT